MWVRGLKLINASLYLSSLLSHPMWVRGLKQKIAVNTNVCQIVAPHVGAWIETPLTIKSKFVLLSHPMWVRGLKPSLCRNISKFAASHPMWVRGLKQLRNFALKTESRVAPHVGAWIETTET